jgi:hypothetical protein
VHSLCRKGTVCADADSVAARDADADAAPTANAEPKRRTGAPNRSTDTARSGVSYYELPLATEVKLTPAHGTARQDQSKRMVAQPPSNYVGWYESDPSDR